MMVREWKSAERRGGEGRGWVGESGRREDSRSRSISEGVVKRESCSGRRPLSLCMEEKENLKIPRVKKKKRKMSLE